MAMILAKRIFRALLVTGLGLSISISASAIDSRLALRFYTLDELANSFEVQTLHYQALKTRFANDDFNEVLFVGDNSEGARLSRHHHRLMLEAIQKFAKAANFAEPEAYFSQRPQYPVFSLVPENSGTVRAEALKLPSSNLGIWLNNFRQAFWSGEALKHMNEASRNEFVRLVAKRNSKVKSIFDLKPAQLAEDSELLDSCLRAYMDLARKDKSNGLLHSAATLVIAKWLQENRLLSSKFSFSELSDLETQFLKMRLQSELVPILKNNQLPSRLANNFFKESGLNESTASPFPKNQVVVIPMSKWEAMFKGIGPGECIRASANRFFDAFYPFSQAFAILKDGKELGYIGVYKVTQRLGERKFWYIDTIQSPSLVQDSGDTKILDGILDQLEKWAIQEGATLAVATKDWNGTNYKENIPRLHARGSIAQVEVAFAASDLLNEIYTFVAHKDQQHHQILMKKSNYTEDKQMYDTLLRNQYNVRVLEPSPRLSASERAQYFRNFGRGLETSPALPEPLREFEELGRFGVSDPSNRLRMLEIFQANRLLFMNSSKAKDLLEKYLFPNVMRAFAEIPQPAEMPRVLQRVYTGSYRAVPSEPFMLELLPMVPNEAEATKLILRLAPSGIEAGQVIDFMIPVLERMNYSEWLKIYPSLLKQMPDDFTDFAIASEFVRQLNSPEDFVKFVEITEGRIEGVLAGYTEPLTRLLVNHFARILRKIEDPEQRLKFLKDTKHFTRRQHDSALVTSYVLNVRSFAEFKRLEAEISNASKLYDDSVRSQMAGRLLLSEQLQSRPNEVMEMLKFLKPQVMQEMLNRTEAMNKIIKAAGESNLLDVYDAFLANASSDAQDILVNERFAAHVPDAKFGHWIAYACGESSKSVCSTHEKRKVYFLSQLVLRLQQEKSSAEAAKLIHSFAKRFGYSALFKLEGVDASALELGKRTEAQKIILAHAISENTLGYLDAKSLYDVAVNLIRLSNYELDISDLFTERPAIGLKIIEALDKEGHRVAVSPAALQAGSKAFYLLDAERERLRGLFNSALHEYSCQRVFR